MTTIVIALDHDGCAAYYAALNSATDPSVIFKGKFLANIIERINSVRHFDPHAKIYVTSLSARQSFLINQYNSLSNSNLSACYVLEAVAIALAQHFLTQIYFDTNLLADSFPGEHMKQQFLTPLNYANNDPADTDDKVIFNDLLSKGYLTSWRERNGNLSYGMKLARLRHIISMFPLDEKIYLFAYDDYEKYLYYLKWYFVNPQKDPFLHTEFWLVDPFKNEGRQHEAKKRDDFCKLKSIQPYLDTNNWRVPWSFQYHPELMEAVYTIGSNSAASRLTSLEHNSLMAQQVGKRFKEVFYQEIVAN